MDIQIVSFEMAVGYIITVQVGSNQGTITLHY